MKTAWKIFWGIAFVAVAVFLVLDALDVVLPFVGVMGEVSIFALFLGVFLLILFVTELFRRHFFPAFLSLAFLFMLFEKNIAFVCKLESENIINNWLLVLVAVLLGIGFSILFSKKKHKSFVYTKSNKNVENVFSGSTVYIDAADFENRFVENSFGGCAIYFTNIEGYKGEAKLRVENSFGGMSIHVPSAWHVSVDLDNSFGSLNVPKRSDNGGPVLYIKGENAFGGVNIKYV